MADPESTLQRSIEGYLIRGGTSKGFFADPAAFPTDPVNRDEVVLELFGSPDPLQVDGLGGSHTHTSKLILVDEADHAGADLAYRYHRSALTSQQSTGTETVATSQARLVSGS